MTVLAVCVIQLQLLADAEPFPRVGGHAAAVRREDLPRRRSVNIIIDELIKSEGG